MPRIDASVKKEIKHIFIGCLIMGGIELGVGVILAAFRVISFDYTVVLGTLCGVLVATLNFASLAFSVQKAIDTGDANAAKAQVTAGYGRRYLFQCLWCIAALTAPCFNGVFGIIPLLFPRLIIHFMQITGYYRQPQEKGGES